MSEPQGSMPPEYRAAITTPTAEELKAAGPQPERTAREIRVVTSEIPIFDTGKFEHMQRVAAMIMKSRAYDDTLRFDAVFDDAAQKSFIREAAEETVLARCVMIVNKAINWQMDPFDLAGSCFYRQGQLVWQGKVIQAVIEKRLDIRLKFELIAAQDGHPDTLAIRCWGRFPDESEDRVVEGSVKFFNRDNSSAWSYAEDWPRMLHYAITREWARLNAPGVILGIITVEEQSRSIAERKVTGRAKVEAPELPDEEEGETEKVDLTGEFIAATGMARAERGKVTTVLLDAEIPAHVQAVPATSVNGTRMFISPDLFIENLEYEIGKCESEEDLNAIRAANEDAIFDLPEAHRIAAGKLFDNAGGGMDG